MSIYLLSMLRRLVNILYDKVRLFTINYSKIYRAKCVFIQAPMI